MSIKLSNLSIGKRIVILSVIALIGIVSIFAIVIIKMDTIKSSQTEYSSGAILKSLVAEVNISALNMRRAEKDFLLRKNKKYIATYRENVANMKQHLGNISQYTSDDILLNSAKNLITLSNQHARQFTLVSDLLIEIGLKETDGLESQLRSNVHDLEGTLNILPNNGPLLIKMLMMRRHEKDFILRNDVKYEKRILARDVEFKELLGKTNYSTKTKAELNDKLTNYISVFQSYVQKQMRFDGSKGKLSSIYKDMTPHFEFLLKQASSILDAKTIEMEEGQSSAISIISIMSLIILIVVFMASWSIIRSITIPLSVLKSSVITITSGDYENKVPGQDRFDELGTISTALDELRLSAKKRIELEKIAEEDRKQRGEEESSRLKAENERTLEEKRSIEEAAAEKEQKSKFMQEVISVFDAGISDTLSSLEIAAKDMDGASVELLDVSNLMDSEATSISNETDSTNASIQTISQAMQEFSMSIQEITVQINNASNMSNEALETLKSGDEALGKMSHASEKIGDVVGIISDISKQTNLLALNATIEAARAGDAGKGFAIVAGEVKNLAMETENATNDIRTQILDMQGATKSTVEAMEIINNVVVEFNKAMVIIAAAIEEQSCATKEITRSVDLAADGSEKISKGISNVSTSANKTQSFASNLQDASKGLDKTVYGIKNNVEKFLAKINQA